MGKTLLATPEWLCKEAVQVLNNALAMTPRLRSIRVRRRGFRSDVKRGDQVRYAGEMWTVARRSNWYLWLYEHVEMIGSTIRVKLPARFAAQNEKTA